MGKNILLDTDVLIDWFQGQKWIKSLFFSDAVFYYSSVTHKELLSKPGLSDTERKTIVTLLRHLRWVPILEDIAEKSSILLRKYAAKGLLKNDAIIAATAWSKQLILFTRNRKHFDFIREIELLKMR